ncbi:MAG: DUF5686 family protein [Bacteroidota bacterium]|nr:DUF5686 family protein [Bacteroidota bacterium]
MTSKGISSSIVKLADSSRATSANSEGSFEIKLPSGKGELIISNIGYISDTLQIYIDSTSLKAGLDIYLRPAELHPQRSLVDKYSSASNLVESAISKKEKSFAELTNYEFCAYNKCVVRENDGVGIGSGSIRVDPGIFKDAIEFISNLWQEKPMRINGIYEFMSKGFYDSPASYRESLINQKEHNYLPPSLLTLLGTRRIQNIMNDELLFFDRPLPGPISYSALRYYRYSFEDTLQIDQKRVFKIKFEPIDKNDPGLIGVLYIEEGSFDILKIEADLNSAANVGNMFEKISLVQQYSPNKIKAILPVDYRMSIISNYMGIIKIQYELSSLMGDYKINLNDERSITSNETLPQLDAKKDTLFGGELQAMPFTQEEEVAKESLDSMRSKSKGYTSAAKRVLAPQYQLSEHYSLSGLSGIYQFNHVEGHTIGVTGVGNGLFNNTFDAKISLSNGFSDKKFKESLSASYYLNNRNTAKLSFSAYNKLAILFASSNIYNSITTTILSLLSRRDIRNYYYTSGCDIRTDVEMTHFMDVYLSYSNHVDHSAHTNTTFSLFGNNIRHSYRNSNNSFSFSDSVNPPIYDVRLNTISLGVNFDFRNNVVEDNLKRKTADGHSFLSYGAGILISDPKYLGSGIGFISYGANLLGEINTFGTSTLGIAINGVYSNGPVPMQMQYALAGNISATGRTHTFRTIGVGTLFGDQVVSMTLEYNFRKEIYRLFPISILRNISLNSFFNAAWKNMSEKSAAIMPVEFTVLEKPLLETGFSFGYSFLPVSLEFAWRLTHIDRSSFRFGVNTSIL